MAGGAPSDRSQGWLDRQPCGADVIPIMQWKPIDPAAAPDLSDAKRQLHHAAQLATAFAISYLAHKPDDSHTNLEWIESAGGFASNSLNGTRVLIVARDLTLEIGHEHFALVGKSLSEAVEWMREKLSAAGLDGARLTLARHYEIPAHAVADGAKFDANPGDLQQLSNIISNAAAVLGDISSSNSNASDVRCWPHHFDIATLLTFPGGKSVGAGMEPGDKYYDEPYFYVNMHPSPPAGGLPDLLRGGGQWHTREWIGAVLPSSRITDDPAAQEMQVREFLSSAIETGTRLANA